MAAKKKANEKLSLILEAARAILAEDGYTAATVSQIAARAGVSRGLLHYYFKNKEELVRKVFRHNMEDILQNTEDIFSRAQGLWELAEELTGALRFIMEADPRFFSLLFESWTLARQSPEGLDLLREFHTRFRRAIAHGFAAMARKGVMGEVENAEGMAAVLTGIVDGLCVQITIDPGLAHDPALWEATRDAVLLLAADKSRGPAKRSDQ